MLPKYGGIVFSAFHRFLPKNDLLSTVDDCYPQFTPSYPQMGFLRGKLSRLNMETTR